MVHRGIEMQHRVSLGNDHPPNRADHNPAISPTLPSPQQ